MRGQAVHLDKDSDDGMPGRNLSAGIPHVGESNDGMFPMRQDCPGRQAAPGEAARAVVGLANMAPAGLLKACRPGAAERRISCNCRAAVRGACRDR